MKKLLLFFVTFMAATTVTNAQQTQNGSEFRPPLSRAGVNVITDCGAVGDGVTDDLAAINTCITNNPGKRIIFPHTQSYPTCDYSISGTINISTTTYDTWLAGESGGNGRAVRICASTDTTGMIFRTRGVKVSDIAMVGNSPINLGDTATYAAGTSDGIMTCGGEFSLINITSDNWSRHGINVASTGVNPCSGGGVSSDVGMIIQPYVSSNRGDGIYIAGSDSNVVSVIGGTATKNGWFGLQDRPFGGSGTIVIGLETDANHSSHTGISGRPIALTSCSVTAGVESCISSVNHNLVSGDIITIAGTSNSAYNVSNPGFFSPIIVDSPTTFHLLTGEAGGGAPDGSSATGGTVDYNLGLRVWAQAGVWGGPIYAWQGKSLFINLYAEANQPGPMIQTPSTIINGLGNIGSVQNFFWGTSSSFPTNTELSTWNPGNGVIQSDPIKMSRTVFTGWLPLARRKSTQSFTMNGSATGPGNDALFNINAVGNGYLDFHRTSVAPATNGWWCWTGSDAEIGSVNTNTNSCMSDVLSTIGGGETWFPNGLWLGAPGVGGPTVRSGRSTIGSFEATAPSGQANYDFLYPDSTAHRWKMNNNNGGAFSVPGVSAPGTSAHVVTFAANGIDLIDGGVIINGTATNCSSSASPAVCASAAAGSVAVPTGTNPTLVVNTTAVTANSQIFLNIDESLGTKLSVTCNTTLSTLVNPVITSRTAGTSFTFVIGAIIATNPACVSYSILN